MKSALGLKMAILLACIFGFNVIVWAEEPEFVTEVVVETGKIIKTTLHRYVVAYGLVEPEPAIRGKSSASSKIAAPTLGILTQIHCEEGQIVSKGDLLFELDTRSSDALIAKAEVAVKFAQKNFARKQQLNSTDNVSRKLYDEAEQMLQSAQKDLLNAKTQRELLQIKSPLTGTVATIHFKVGESVNLNTVLADLIDLQRLDIAIRIPSQEANLLRLGQSVDMSPASTPVWKSGQNTPNQRNVVTFIGPQIDALTDTVLVRASLSRDAGLRPGQFIHVRILVEERPDRLAVPIESIVTREKSSVIAVVDGNTAKQTVIKPGLREGNLVEVTGEKLQAGMTIVTQGAYSLPTETRIRVLK